MDITKVVIPAAGFGTRFLPQTKAMPKEMLPIVDKPVIQYVVEEAVESGIKDVIIVTNSMKTSIEDHFDVPNEDLLKNLAMGNKDALIEEVNRISAMANFIYVRQKGPYGNGTPILAAEPIVCNEPFAVLWGDEFIYAKPARLAQMKAIYKKYGGVLISGVKIEKKEDLKRYGILDVEPIEGNLFKLNKIVEKPEPDDAPSDIAGVGAYILPPEIFDALRAAKPGKGGEIYLVDAINILKEQGIPIYATLIENAKYYDTGNKLEYMKTVIDFALRHPDLNGEFRKYLESIVK